MFDISWGLEFIIVSGIGIALIGRQDLPRVSHFLGTQVGKAVGWIQGARIRADAYASQNELRQLHQQVRVGLRQLDVVRSEFTSSGVSSSNLMSSHHRSSPVGLQTSMMRMPPASSINNYASNHSHLTFISPHISSPSSETLNSSHDLESASSTVLQGSTNNTTLSSSTIMNHTATTSTITTTSSSFQTPPPQLLYDLPPRAQTVAAVAEEQWKEQGIGFTSRAERGSSSASYFAVEQSGSVILSNLLQQSLIHDQYDRVMREQQQEESMRMMQQQQQQQVQEQVQEERRLKEKDQGEQHRDASKAQ
jgi:hypothetical protein